MRVGRLEMVIYILSLRCCCFLYIVTPHEHGVRPFYKKLRSLLQRLHASRPVQDEAVLGPLTWGSRPETVYAINDTILKGRVMMCPVHGETILDVVLSYGIPGLRLCMRQAKPRSKRKAFIRST